MAVRTRIKTVAKARGWSVAQLAHRLGMYASNLSAMDAGRRSASLRVLDQIAQVLGCAPGELIDIDQDFNTKVFQDPRSNQRIQERDQDVSDGQDRGWTHRVQLAWRQHYASSRPQS